MCEKCDALDERIRKYQAMAARVLDQQTLDGIKHLVQEMEAQKKALHPDR